MIGQWIWGYRTSTFVPGETLQLPLFSLPKGNVTPPGTYIYIYIYIYIILYYIYYIIYILSAK